MQSVAEQPNEHGQGVFHRLREEFRRRRRMKLVEPLHAQTSAEVFVGVAVRLEHPARRREFGGPAQ